MEHLNPFPGMNPFMERALLEAQLPGTAGACAAGGGSMLGGGAVGQVWPCGTNHLISRQMDGEGKAPAAGVVILHRDKECQ
ncbi:MAG: hypothetical protein ACKVY0_24425 [Prosthecobacter sp.]|uniref:hypothetical protein n=1 Tax=Prosthecobacter sp. TaxID=1965333 RepID=UPI0038FEF949